MEEDLKHLREMVQQLQGDVQDARDVARRLKTGIEAAVQDIEEGQGLAVAGDLKAALSYDEETIESWPESV